MSYELAVINSKLITQNLTLLGLLAVFLTLATIYSAVVPLGEGPDEPGHADYAFFLAQTGRLPVQRLDSRQADVPGEGHQPPLAYALAAPLALALPRDERRTDTIGNPRFVWSGGDQPNAISHGSREYPPWRGSVLAWHLMRLVSVVCGAATVFFTYLTASSLAKRLEIRDWSPNTSQSTIYNLQSAMPLLAAGLVAFNPQFLFVAALVTNDALLAALSALLLWLVVRNEERRKSGTTEETRRLDFYLLRRSIILGVVLGLALLTKQSAIILIPVGLLALVVWHGDERIRPAIGGIGSRTGLASRARYAHPLTRSPVYPLSLLNVALAIVVMALVAGWWYARNQRLYGDLFGLAAFRGEFATQPFQISSPAAWIAALGQLHASFWARFGWMNVFPPAWVLWLFGAIELLALGGLVRLAVRMWQADRSSADDRRSSTVGHWALLALPALALAWMVSFAITAGLVAWQGRLLFPALPAIAILMARGLAAWENKEQRTRNNPSKRLILFSVLCSLFLVAAWIPANVIRPAYPPQTLPESVAIAQAGNSVVFRFRRRGERSITLRGWRLDTAARPGAALDLTLTWYASARQVRDWVVFIQLADGQGRVVAETHGEPREGMFPTTQWNIGDWIADRHRLQLPADLTGGTYNLRLWLQDSQNSQRAEVRIDESRPLGNVLDLGSIIVTTPHS
jgi:4-amino-4-deoxy-L-arabinose transferase-like glycosyltransferase